MMDQALMQERMIKEAMANKKEKEHTFEDTIAEMEAVREAQNAGSWRIVAPSGSFPVAHFVKNTERDQYNLLTDGEYKTEQRANLALALLTRPTQLTYQERAAMLEILLGKE